LCKYKAGKVAAEEQNFSLELENFVDGVKFLEKDMFGFYSYGFIHGYKAH
jgi:hypothetical protein